MRIESSGVKIFGDSVKANLFQDIKPIISKYSALVGKPHIQWTQSRSRASHLYHNGFFPWNYAGMMEVVENKFKNYRHCKSHHKQMKDFGDVIKSPLTFVLKGENGSEQSDKSTLSIQQPEKETFANSLVNGFVDYKSSGDSDILTSSDEIDCIKPLNSGGQFLSYTLCFVYIAFWATLYKIAIELQFGIVFLMFSALGGIYLNTRIGPKNRKEISAYSVFNKDCKSIDGTLKVEQFEREFGII